MECSDRVSGRDDGIVSFSLMYDSVRSYCLHVLKGHTSTIRCVKALDGRPIAVSASRNGQLRVWDIEKGYCLRVLEGHEASVRALDVVGNVAVSGSYDYTARVRVQVRLLRLIHFDLSLQLWNVDTGECIRVLRGHHHQIYSVAFDGKFIATGSLDSTVRLWDFDSGKCLALLHSYLITGGNDGCVKLFERETGTLVRELTKKCDGVWKVVMRKDKCVIMCKRDGKTVIEVLSFAPTPDQL